MQVGVAIVTLIIVAKVIRVDFTVVIVLIVVVILKEVIKVIA
jgi:hypothetical protein